MQLGFAVPVAGSWATPGNQVRLARRAEELGYASLWTFQRLLFPGDPGEAAARWQPVYRSVADPLVTLAYLAGHTGRARLGVAVLNMPWFSPLLLAKQAASLDVVSGGRLDLGLGLGWAREEYAAAGAPFAARGRRADDFLRCLRALWAGDPGDQVSYDGEFHHVPPALVEPRPVQRPHPPLLLGGQAEAALVRAGRLADGWVSSSGQDLASVGRSIGVVRRAAEQAGRDPQRLRFVSRGVVRVREDGAGGGARPDRRPLTGTLEQIRADLDLVAAQGVTELFVDLNFDSRIGTPDADPDESVRRADEVLDALAPGRGG